MPLLRDRDKEVLSKHFAEKLQGPVKITLSCLF